MNDDLLRDATADGLTSRRRWLALMDRVARPVSEALADGRLLRDVERGDPPLAPTRDRFFVLEALGRTLSGIGPWLEGDAGDAAEQQLRADLRTLAVRAIRTAADPDSPDAATFEVAGGTWFLQPVVDASMLARAFLQAPQSLWATLDARTRGHLVEQLRLTRQGLPHRSNWLMFAAMTETFLRRIGASDWDPMRIDYALSQHAAWYAGDGLYRDGPAFHLDYYNSLVILPWLVEVAEANADYNPLWQDAAVASATHLRRTSQILERLVASDGTFPPVGRSLAYRCGVFHALALSSLRQDLPEDVAPGVARSALTAVLMRTLEPPGTFTPGGWLTPGLAGRQPGLAEGYINVGSLYACCWAFLPLGLPPEAPFWREPGGPWTQVRLWRGEDGPADKALK